MRMTVPKQVMYLLYRASTYQFFFNALLVFAYFVALIFLFGIMFGIGERPELPAPERLPSALYYRDVSSGAAGTSAPGAFRGDLDAAQLAALRDFREAVLRDPELRATAKEFRDAVRALGGGRSGDTTSP